MAAAGATLTHEITGADIARLRAEGGRLTTAAAAPLLGVRPQTVTLLIRRGRRDGVRLEGWPEAGRWLTTRAAVDRFLAARVNARLVTRGPVVSPAAADRDRAERERQAAAAAERMRARREATRQARRAARLGGDL